MLGRSSWYDLSCSPRHPHRFAKWEFFVSGRMSQLSVLFRHRSTMWAYRLARIMLKVFRGHLKEALIQRVHRADSAFAVRKKPLGRAYRGSLILEKHVCSSFTGFVHIQFVEARNYVIPSVQWTMTGEYPNEASCHDMHDAMLRKGKRPEQIRDQSSQGWLDRHCVRRIQELVRIG
jgi:hypothetical protein